jgi:copper resistance protein B
VKALYLLALCAAMTHSAFAQEHPHAAQPTSSEPTPSELKHVPPDPPQQMPGAMSNERMIELMDMNDAATFVKVLVNELEWQRVDDGDGTGNVMAWDAHAWVGGDYHKLWVKTEGEHGDGETESRNELLWDRIVGRWWSAQAGVRHDMFETADRTWFAVGIQGLAPQWFEIDATLYLGGQGRTALRASVEYELLLTQRLILQPQFELNVYGTEDPDNGIGSGLSDAELGLRLRYEIRRKLAPYLGVEWSRAFGKTADFAREASRKADDVRIVAGLRAWF